MTPLLLIEDDLPLGKSVSEMLKAEGFDVTWSQNLAEARANKEKEYQLIILDWMLPDGQGIDFLRDFRKDNTHTPVIMLTARTELVDKVLGLETGANDYLTKPFEPRELVARIRVQLRIQDQAPSTDSSILEENLISLGAVTINASTREIRHEQDLIETTKMEFDLLKLLAQNPGRAFSREEILNKVWGYENYPTTRTVDTHVLQLRQKIPLELIETVRGIGYRLRKPN